MNAGSIDAVFDQLAEAHPTYRRDSFAFVREAVNFTVGRLPAHRHVTAFELLEGARDYAEEQYGVLASTVLTDLGLDRAVCFGEVVYLLIEARVLEANDEDSEKDFDIRFELAPEALPPQSRRHRRRAFTPIDIT